MHIKASIFSVLVASPPPIGNFDVYCLPLYFSSPSMSTNIPSSVILDVFFLAPHCHTGIWSWWITAIFSSSVLSMLSLSSILFCVCGIVTGNETGFPSISLIASLDLCGTIISRLNFPPRSPLTKSLSLVIIYALIVCRNVREKWCCIPPLLQGQGILFPVFHLPQKGFCR